LFDLFINFQVLLSGMGEIGFLAFSGCFNLMVQKKILISVSVNIIPFHQIFYHLSLKLLRLLEQNILT